jgi:hypothetical protein
VVYGARQPLSIFDCLQAEDPGSTPCIRMEWQYLHFFFEPCRVHAQISQLQMKGINSDVVYGARQLLILILSILQAEDRGSTLCSRM